MIESPALVCCKAEGESTANSKPPIRNSRISSPPHFPDSKESAAPSPVSRFLRLRTFRKRSNLPKSVMGAALGNCCAGRDDTTIKEKAKEKFSETWDFLQGEQITSDVDKFDKAYGNSDIKAFVDLIKSKEPIEPLETRMHPWAADPKTVGSLATTQLAILAAKAEETEYKDKIREAGAIPALVKNLNTTEDDLLHASVVALSFLSVENPKNCIEMYESGAFPMLVKLMEADKEGLRGATAQTCRNIYILDLKYRAEFKKCGGVQALVKLLDLPKGDYDPENLYNQLEAVYHVEDLILEAGDELEEYVAEVKKAGAVRRLETLIKINNPDLVEAAQFLLVRLAD